MMMEQQPLTAADVGAVMRANGGYGYGGYPMPVMPMYPAMGGYGGGFGNGFGFGGDFLSILLLFALFGGGWGGFGGFGGGMAGAGLGLADGGLLGYAIGNNATKGDVSMGLQNVQNGSKLDNISTQLSNGFSNNSNQLCNGFAGVSQQLSNGFANTSTQLCNGFADVQSAICNSANNINTGLLSGFANSNLANCQNTNSITNAIDNNRFSALQSANAIQTQIAQNGFNAQQCCCDTKSAIADLKYSVALENCADRDAIGNGIRDILTNQTANTQKLLDKLCDQELQAERRENQNLRSELMYARGQASQIEQTAQLRASLSTIPQTTYNLLETCPISTTPVYGRTPIFTCTTNLAGNNWNNGCGCGSQFVA